MTKTNWTFANTQARAKRDTMNERSRARIAILTPTHYKRALSIDEAKARLTAHLTELGILRTEENP
jgi:hypothetical protein